MSNTEKNIGMDGPFKWNSYTPESNKATMKKKRKNSLADILKSLRLLSNEMAKYVLSKDEFKKYKKSSRKQKEEILKKYNLI